MTSYYICDWKIRKLSGKAVSDLIDVAINCDCLLFAGEIEQTSTGNYLTFLLETASEHDLKEFVTKVGIEYGLSEWIPEPDEEMPEFLNISRSRGKLALTEVCQTFGEP